MTARKSSPYMVAARAAVVTMLLCGLVYPLLVTGVAQVAFPYQANGELVSLGGRVVGSNLIGQNFTSDTFFQGRNDSASGVDPDIPDSMAYVQAQTISSETGIPLSSLDSLIKQNTIPLSSAFGDPYVNVLQLNILLVETHPSVYQTGG